MSRERAAWVLPVSLLVALVLAILPLPVDFAPMRPYFLGLALAYWVLEEPDKVGLGFAFLIGLVADLTIGGLLGEQALRLTILAFILQRFRARLRFFPMSQQALAIGALLFNDRIVTSAVHLALGEPALPLLAWVAPAIGMLLWAPMFLLFDTLRLRTWRHR
jgi:rod shape-determining protein MreD